MYKISLNKNGSHRTYNILVSEGQDNNQDGDEDYYHDHTKSSARRSLMTLGFNQLFICLLRADSSRNDIILDIIYSRQAIMHVIVHRQYQLQYI